MNVEAETLNLKSEFDRLTTAERYSLSRWQLCQFYGINGNSLTMALIERDRDGLRGKVREFEKLFSPDGEELSMAAARESAGGSAVDADRSLAARRVRIAIGLPEMVALLQTRALSKEAPEMIAFADRCVQMAGTVKSAVNYSVKAGASPVKILGELLGQVGVCLICTRTRIGGKQIRVYQINSENLVDLTAIAETRYQNGIDRAEQCESHPSDKTLQRGVTHTQIPPKPDEGEAWEDVEPSDMGEELEWSYEFEWEEEAIAA